MTEAATPIGRARLVLARAIHDRVFPAAVAEVGASGGVLWREALGTLTFEAGAPPATDDTVFDLASLTKPIATTTVTLDLMPMLLLHDRLSDHFPEWKGPEREEATIRDLLEHTAGLPARLPAPPPETPEEFERAICALPLEYAPRTRSIYSDLGFILLGWLAWSLRRVTIADGISSVLYRVAKHAHLDRSEINLAFRVGGESLINVAPTDPLPDDPRRGRILIGEVHDPYAAVLGRVAGHAGLFGSAPSVGAFARTVLRAARGDAAIPIPLSPTFVSLAATRSTVPGSSRALGWDTMVATSSCGTMMSPAAIGHVGFTGTSLWIDPVLDRYFVLLTNRACGGGTITAMLGVRRAFHDALATL